jgi:phage-related protein
MPDASEVLATVDNTAIKIEQTLYKLYTAVAGPGFQGILKQLPTVILDAVQNTLRNVLDSVAGIVKQLTDPKIINGIKDVISAGRDVVASTLDLLPASAQGFAETAKRFLSIIVDFVNAGIDHIVAIVDLLMKVVGALAGKIEDLAAATIASLNKSGLALPANTAKLTA